MSETDDFDVDLSAYLRAVGRLWWLVVLLAVVGALTGLGLSRTAARTYSATSAVYLGQPTDANGNSISGLPSNPRAAQQIVQGADVLSEAVKRLHGEVKLSTLRHAKITTPAAAAKSTTTPSNIVSITVVSRSARKSADGANALAQILVSRLNDFSNAKIALLEQQISSTQSQLAATSARLAAAQRRLATNGAAGGMAAATYLAVVQSASTEQQALQATLQAGKLSLLVARNVETSAVITAAVVRGATRNAPATRTSTAGGFMAGIVVALVIAAFTMRRRKPEPAAA